jgi:hypothetical protein
LELLLLLKLRCVLNLWHHFVLIMTFWQFSALVYHPIETGRQPARSWRQRNLDHVLFHLHSRLRFHSLLHYLLLASKFHPTVDNGDKNIFGGGGCLGGDAGCLGDDGREVLKVRDYFRPSGTSPTLIESDILGFVDLVIDVVIALVGL